MRSALRGGKLNSKQNGEEGVVVVLVAVFMLFVIGAMAALAVDLVTFYTARSEAQQGADAGALAGARVLANSGMTSDPSVWPNLRNTAITIATEVAVQNKVGDASPNVAVSFPNESDPDFHSNPHVFVEVSRTDLPVFFSRILGRTAATVKATATAETYNPSGIVGGPPVAPLCVKPWLLPNIDPTSASGTTIIDATSGTITNAALIGQTWLGPGIGARCSSCTTPMPAPQAGTYYPGAIDPIDSLAFPPPSQSRPLGSAGFTPYQLAVAACVPRPIACGQNANINIDTNTYTPHTTDRDADSVEATKLAIRDSGANGDSDSIDPAWVPSQPFQFIGGNANRVAGAVAEKVFVSDSLATIPVFDSTGFDPNSPTVTVIGFVQVFMNPQGTIMAGPRMPATIINISGCGTNATGQAVIGNGASPVPVRLVH